MNLSLLLCTFVLGADGAAPSEFARQSRGFFEKLIDFKVESGLLAVRLDPSGSSGRSLFDVAVAAFPNAGMIRIQTPSSGISTHRGGSGNVIIRIGGAGEATTLDFQITGASGDESLHLTQNGPGALSIQITRGGSSVEYTQAAGKCQLKLKVRGDRLSIVRKSFKELFDENADLVEEHFIGFLEAYFDKVPFSYVGTAPPGKAIFVLRDGGKLIGEVKGPDLRLETDYGTLSLPWSEVRRISFPSAAPEKLGADRELSLVAGEPGRTEPMVVTIDAQRFAPRGRLDVQSFEVWTTYGRLEVKTSELGQVLVGPKVADPPAKDGAEEQKKT
jgi:hypothetical protein